MTTPIITEPIAEPIPTAVDYQQLYLEQKEEAGRLKAILSAARISGVPTHAPGADKRPPVSAEHIRRSLSPVAYLNLTRAQKLEALGLNPDSVTDAGLKRLFGRGNDGAEARDLHNSDPLKYKTLKEAAKILNLYGA